MLGRIHQQDGPSTRKRTVGLAAAIVLIFTAPLLVKLISDRGEGSAAAPPPEAAVGGPAPCQRIVSLAPSNTETLYALGLGDQVVGVTRYCSYPPEVIDKAQVGGYTTPNYEAILALEPDRVVVLPEHEQTVRYLDDLGLDRLIVDHRTLPGILESIEIIGEACDRSAQAAQLRDELQGRIDRVQARTADLPRPHVMVSIGRHGGGTLERVTIAGREGFYDALIELAGGTNVYRGEAVRFPVVSAEGIRRMDPEVIIDLAPDLDLQPGEEQRIQREWDVVGDARAIRDGRVHVFTDGYIVVPGPRTVLLLEQMARVIHPELSWETP